MELPSLLPAELGYDSETVSTTEELFEASTYGGDALGQMAFAGDYVEFLTKLVLPSIKVMPPTRAKITYGTVAAMRPVKSEGKIKANTSKATIAPVGTKANYYA